MARDEDDRSVDFVVGDDPIAAPSEPGPVLPDRRRRTVVALLVAALVVAGVLWRTVGPKQRSPIAAPTSAATSPATSPASSAAPDVSWRPLAPTALLTVPNVQPVVLDARTGAVIRCPTDQACTVTSHLPGSVLRAIRAEFPTATIVSASSAILRRDNARFAYLAQRTVLARAGATTITVELRGPGQVPARRSGTVDRSVMRTAEDGRSVTVTASVAAGTPPPNALLDRLVADPRLLAQ